MPDTRLQSILLDTENMVSLRSLESFRRSRRAVPSTQWRLVQYALRLINHSLGSVTSWVSAFVPWHTQDTKSWIDVCQQAIDL
jgi:hypothetical protein